MAPDVAGGHRPDLPIHEPVGVQQLTLILWIIAASAFSLYLDSFANYRATYAGLAGIMSALILRTKYIDSDPADRGISCVDAETFT